MKKTTTKIKKLYSMIAVCAAILLTVILPQSSVAQCQNDNIPPVIDCPDNITMNATTNTCARVVNFPAPTATDNCGTTSTVIWTINNVTFDDGGTASGYFVFNAGTNAISDWSISVSGGNTTNFPVLTYSPANSTASNFTNFVLFQLNTSLRQVRFQTASPKTNSGGTLPLDIAGNPNRNIECYNCTPFRLITGGSMTGVRSLTITQTAGLPSGSSFPLGTTTNTFRATDAAGNSASCSFTVTINDAQPPTITCPANMTLNNTPNTCGRVVNYAMPTATDNCDANSSEVKWTLNTVTFADGGTASGSFVFNAGANTVSNWSISVSGGNTVSFPPVTYTSSNSTVISFGNKVIFEIAPNRQLRFETAAAKTNAGGTLPLDIAGNPNSNIECYNCTPFRYINGGSIVGTPGVTITQTAGLPSGSTFPKGTTTNTFMATDAAGNSASCSFTVTINDNEPPTITCPSNTTVQCASAVPAHDFAGGTASDNCPGAVGVTWVSDVISNQTCANRYTITRTYRATDASNNSRVCTQTITVNDNTAPTISCPGPVTADCVGNVPLPTPTTVTASDNCGQVTVTWEGDVISNQTCANRYTITRTYKATDACGNSATCTQTINVFDNTPPMITCPQTATVQCASAVPPPAPNAVSASDNCGPVIVTWEGDVISNQTCANRYTVTRTYKARDACGNSTTCTQTINVFDDTPPTLTCPPDKIIPFTGVCTYDVTPTNTGSPTNVTDNCAGQVTVTYTDVVSQCGSNTVITRTWTATDVCGNSSACVQTITASDNNTPYIIYAAKEAKFGEDNDINGDVGVTDANGKAEFKKNNELDPYHVYAKNITVQMPAMVNHKHFMPATGGPNPTFMPYVANPLSGNYTQSINGVVPAGNYKELTIKKGVTATVNGSNYGKVRIEEGANVTFTSSNINMEELTVGKGKKDVATTNVYFTTCAAVKIKDRVTIEEDCRINVGGPKVNFYLGDSKKDEENFMVKGDDTQITLNIMIPNGKLKIEKKSDNCIMTGWFIVEKLESTGMTTWNKYDCAPPPPIAMPVTSKGGVIEVKEIPAVAKQDAFAVTVLPNPTASIFNIRVTGSSDESVTIRVMDISGKVLEVKTGVSKGSTVTVGAKLLEGAYFAEVIQGNNRQVVKLVKLN